MALGDTFDLGRVIQTAEAIKGIRRQSENDALQSAYFRQKMQNEQTTFDQQQRQYSAEEQLRNTQIANVAAAEIATDPSAVTRWLPQLKQAGIVDPTFDPNSLSPDLIQQGARNIYERTAAALAAHQAQTAKPAGPTNDMQNYGFYSQQERASGRPVLSFDEWKLRGQKAGATTVNVNTGQKFEDAGAKAFGEAEGKAFGDTLQRGSDAQDRVDKLRAMMDNPALTGPTQDFRAAANQFFSDLGVPVSPGTVSQITNLSQYKAAQGKLVFDELAKQKGPQTEGDAQRAQQLYGNSKTIREANQAILRYQMAVADRESEIAQIAENYRVSTGKLDGWRKAVRDYVRSTPLNGYDPDSKRLVFFDEFKRGMREDNPTMTDEQIVDYWRQRYGR